MLREEISAKLGLHTFDYGLSPERLPDLAQHAFTGLPPLPPLTWAVSRALGIDLLDAVALSNDPRFYSCLIPSGNIVSTADEACRFFQLLLNEGELDGVRIFDPRTVRRAVEASGVLEIDSFLGLPVRYGIGFMLGNAGPGLYGWNAPRAFGHVGFTTVLAWADPDRALSACLMTSGKPFVTPEQVRWMQAIYTIAARTPRVTSSRPRGAVSRSKSPRSSWFWPRGLALSPVHNQARVGNVMRVGNWIVLSLVVGLVLVSTGCKPKVGAEVQGGAVVCTKEGALFCGDDNKYVAAGCHGPAGCTAAGTAVGVRRLSRHRR